MKYFGKHCWWLVILLLVLGSQISLATSPILSPVKDILLEPMSNLTTDGPVKMSMTVIPKEGFGDTLVFQIMGTHGLSPVGPDKRTVLANKDGNFETEFEILISKNDTSRLTVHIVPGQPWIQQARFFVTVTDTVEYFRIHPLDYAFRVRPQSESKVLSIKPEKPTSPDSSHFRFWTEPAPRAETQTVDESKSPLSQGIMTHTDWLCFDIAPVTNDITLAPGIVNFRLRVVPHWKCESFQVDVVEVDNLKYLGEMSWTFEASAGDTVYFPISVELPENDTTGMVFEVGGCECRLHTAAYFTTTAVDAKFYRSDPSKSGDRLIEARDAANRREIERARDSIAQLPPPPPVDE